MKTNLNALIPNFNFKALFTKKGYAYFERGSYNLNIIGIRKKGNTVTNKFDDACVVIYKDANGKEQRKLYNITTTPGASFMGKDSYTKTGTAILVPGQYRGAWQIGLHRGQYKALCQRKPVKIYRDNDKDNQYDFEPQTIDSGVFGINLHKAGTMSYVVNNWSAGCQVWQVAKDFTEFMKLCQKQIDYKHGDTFTYTLINEEDLL